MSRSLAIGIKDAAMALSISPWTLRKYIRQGNHSVCVRIGRRVLIEPAELEALIQRNRRRGSV